MRNVANHFYLIVAFFSAPVRTLSVTASLFCSKGIVLSASPQPIRSFPKSKSVVFTGLKMESTSQQLNQGVHDDLGTDFLSNPWAIPPSDASMRVKVSPELMYICNQ